MSNTGNIPKDEGVLSYERAVAEPLPPITAETVFRRLIMWTVIVWVCAAPSFVWALKAFDLSAMVTGVFLFIAIYTACTCTRAFERFHRLPHIRRTLYVGYGARILLSIAFPVAMFVDLFPGLLSIRIVRTVWASDSDFVGTLLVTMVQGAIINVLVFLFMCIVYLFLWTRGNARAAAGPPPDAQDQMRKYQDGGT